MTIVDLFCAHWMCTFGLYRQRKWKSSSDILSLLRQAITSTWTKTDFSPAGTLRKCSWKCRLQNLIVYGPHHVTDNINGTRCCPLCSSHAFHNYNNQKWKLVGLFCVNNSWAMGFFILNRVMDYFWGINSLAWGKTLELPQYSEISSTTLNFILTPKTYPSNDATFEK